MSDILAVPEQGPEQGEIGLSSSESSVRFVIEEGHVLLGGTTGSGKSSAAAAILAALQPGTRVRVIDPKSPWAMEFIREAGEQ
ncbi:type IV secretion system DNA-binding domain-containing protein [Streptomyces sp. G45]|uniref:type IV secretion system DNA-binding domain-containing protein n=1 Tax=Streptomyces sp. G45 TaxID=3406627 RepID=UPI003C2A989E